MSDDYISEGQYQEEQAALEALNEYMENELVESALQKNDSLELWMTKDKQRIDYHLLSDKHISNILAMLERTGFLYCVPRLQIESRRRRPTTTISPPTARS